MFESHLLQYKVDNLKLNLTNLHATQTSKCKW